MPRSGSPRDVAWEQEQEHLDSNIIMVSASMNERALNGADDNEEKIKSFSGQSMGDIAVEGDRAEIGDAKLGDNTGCKKVTKLTRKSSRSTKENTTTKQSREPHHHRRPRRSSRTKLTTRETSDDEANNESCDRPRPHRSSGERKDKSQNNNNNNHHHHPSRSRKTAERSTSMDDGGVSTLRPRSEHIPRRSRRSTEKESSLAGSSHTAGHAKRSVKSSSPELKERRRRHSKLTYRDRSEVRHSTRQSRTPASKDKPDLASPPGDDDGNINISKSEHRTDVRNSYQDRSESSRLGGSSERQRRRTLVRRTKSHDSPMPIKPTKTRLRRSASSATERAPPPHPRRPLESNKSIPRDSIRRRSKRMAYSTTGDSNTNSIDSRTRLQLQLSMQVLDAIDKEDEEEATTAAAGEDEEEQGADVLLDNDGSQISEYDSEDDAGIELTLRRLYGTAGPTEALPPGIEESTEKQRRPSLFRSSVAETAPSTTKTDESNDSDSDRKERRPSLFRPISYRAETPAKRTSLKKEEGKELSNTIKDGDDNDNDSVGSEGTAATASSAMSYAKKVAAKAKETLFRSTSLLKLTKNSSKDHTFCNSSVPTMAPMLNLGKHPVHDDKDDDPEDDDSDFF